MTTRTTASAERALDELRLLLPPKPRKWRVGMDCGETFHEGDDFDGWTMLIELDNEAQADAVARALRIKLPHWQPDPDSPGRDHA